MAHEDPRIWEVLDHNGDRLTTIVKHTAEEAFKEAKQLFAGKMITVRDTGKRKPAGKCCDTCGDTPCEKRK